MILMWLQRELGLSDNTQHSRGLQIFHGTSSRKMYWRLKVFLNDLRLLFWTLCWDLHGQSQALLRTFLQTDAYSILKYCNYWLLTCSIALYILRLWGFFLMLSSKSRGVLDICSAKCNVSVYSDIQLCEWISSTNGNYANMCVLPWALLKGPQSF